MTEYHDSASESVMRYGIAPKGWKRLSSDTLPYFLYPTYLQMPAFSLSIVIVCRHNSFIAVYKPTSAINHFYTNIYNLYSPYWQKAK